MTTLPRLPGIERLSQEGLRELVRVADKLGCSPREMAAVVFLESSFRVTARNKDTGATGLFQWKPAVARAFGTTVEQIAAMADVEQFRLAGRTWADKAGKLTRTGDFYVAVFYPSALGASDDHVIAAAPSDVYERNKGRDYDGDGTITVRDIRATVLDLLAVYPMTVEVDASASAPATTNAGTVEGGLIVVGVLGALLLWWRSRR